MKSKSDYGIGYINLSEPHTFENEKGLGNVMPNLNPLRTGRSARPSEQTVRTWGKLSENGVLVYHSKSAVAIKGEKTHRIHVLDLKQLAKKDTVFLASVQGRDANKPSQRDRRRGRRDQ